MTFFTLATTTAQQAEIETHWANVRAGLHTAAPHTFRDESKAEAIRRHKDTAERLIELAAWNMRQADRLSEVDI